MAEAISEESVLDLLKDDSKFSAKIEQLTKVRKESEKVKSEAVEAVEAYRRHKVETDAYVAGKKAELDAKQKEHDTAAKEAADRIAVQQAQMVEVLRVQAQVKEAAAAVDAKSKALEQREKLLKDAQTAFASRLHDIEEAQDLVKRQQAHMAALPR